MVNICITTLNNFSGLKEEIDSIESGTLKPDKYIIFDNSRKLKYSDFSIDNLALAVPNEQESLARSWNWFIDNVPEIRVICNDDLIFYPDTLETLVRGLRTDTIYFPYGIAKTNTYSCFVISDEVISKVGRFDEEFYPAYFEDNSYDYKLSLQGLYVDGVADCNIIHKGSQTLHNYTHSELDQHHKNFQKNRELYVKMWGGMPKNEIYKTKFNR